MAIEQSDEPYTEIDSLTADRMIQNRDVYVIDVREPNEWNEGHIAEATLVPLNTFLKSPRQHLQQGNNVLFYCAMGQRSAVASEMAAAIGVQHVYNLGGGFTDWKNKGLPVAR